MKFKNLFNFLKINRENHLGIDFSGSHLRLLEIRKDKKDFDIKAWSERKIPKGILEQRRIVKQEEFIDFFKEAIENSEGSFSERNVVLTIPEEKIFTRVITIPKVENKKSLEEIIRWEAEASMPVAISEIYYDWEIIKEDKEKTNVLIMATNREIVDNYLEVFNELNLNVLALEPESLSMARSLNLLGTEDYNLIIDLGDNSSNFIICKKGLPIFTSSSSISSKTITNTIVRVKGVSFEKAERYKIKVGLEESQLKNSKNKTLFDSFLTSLVDEISKMKEFLNYNLFLDEKNKKINKIILSGCGSNLKGLDSYLTIKLRQPVSQSNPWLNFNFNKNIPPISKQKSQGFAPVVGLTLKIKANEKTINLLPKERRDVIKIDNFNRFVMKINFIIGSALIVLLTFLGAMLFILNIYHKINDEAIQRDTGGKLSAVISQAKKEIDQQHIQIDKTLKHFENRKPYWNYLDKINATLPEKVYLKKVEINEENIFIQGIADNRDDLLSFETALKKQDYFKNIEMPISNLTSQENVNFEIIVNLNKE